MNRFDIILIIILAVFALDGYHKGFFRETLNVIGLILVIYLSFILMSPIASILLKYLPVITLSIFGVEVEALNILIYQIIAFILLTILLYLAWRFIIDITGLLAKVIGLNSFLRIPLKILGGLVGIVTGYVVLFLILLALSIPLNNKFTSYHDSTLKDAILNNKILRINAVKKLNSSIDEIYDLSSRIDNDSNRMKHTKQYNAETMDIMLKNKIISIDTVDVLIKKEKIHTYDELNKVLLKYRND